MGQGSFEGRVALITGASRGIGFAAAEEIVGRGGKVTITGRDADALAAAVKDLGGSGVALGVAGKADDPEHARATVEATMAEFGRLDHFVANAAVNPVYGPILSAPPAAVRKVFDVNIIGAVEWIRLVHEAWMAEHGGSIVTMSSVTGLGASPGIGVYGVSKAALIALTEQLAVELAPKIRVNAIAPGLVETKFAAAIVGNPMLRDHVVNRTPLARHAQPPEIAGAAVYLLSDAASFTTGTVLVVDGGLTSV